MEEHRKKPQDKGEGIVGRLCLLTLDKNYMTVITLAQRHGDVWIKGEVLQGCPLHSNLMKIIRSTGNYY
jgi:hypothetical protein